MDQDSSEVGKRIDGNIIVLPVDSALDYTRVIEPIYYGRTKSTFFLQFERTFLI